MYPTLATPRIARGILVMLASAFIASASLETSLAKSKNAPDRPARERREALARVATQKVPHSEWCGTPETNANSSKAGCPANGACDDPFTRDSTPTDMKVIKTVVTFVRCGGDNELYESIAQDAIYELNFDYSFSNIQFYLEDTRVITDNNLCQVPAGPSSAVKSYLEQQAQSHAVTPDQVLNIMVSKQAAGGNLAGRAQAFPWENPSQPEHRSVWVNIDYFGYGGKTATHEVGHVLGLWHTHHGVDEVTVCGDCYEYADGFEGDYRGDFCWDTAPTPTNFNCMDPGGQDCTGWDWNFTDYDNFMGYGPDTCVSWFSFSQDKRMHCWFNDTYPGWLAPPQLISGTVTVSGMPLEGVWLAGLTGPGGNVYTNSSGYYSATVEYGGSVLVTPILGCYDFQPPLANHEDVTAPVTQNYTATYLGGLTVNVNQPSGGETWQAGEQHTISWSIGGGCPVDGQEIFVSRNGGASFQSIITLGSGVSQYNWTVTGPGTTNAIIRVSAHNDHETISDDSPSFSIVGPPQFSDATPPHLDIDVSWGAISWVDFDGDGDQDFYLASTDPSRQDLLFTNGGNHSPGYADLWNGLQVNYQEHSFGASWANFNNSGLPEVVLVKDGSANELYRLDLEYVEIGAGLGMDDAGGGQVSIWGDVNNDGNIDLFVGNSSGPNALYLNYITSVLEPTQIPGHPLNGLGVYAGAFFDYDDDGDQDVVLCGTSNALFRNDGQNIFTEVSSGPGSTSSDISAATGTVDCSLGDYDNDGDFDLFLSRSSYPNRLIRNDGNGVFVEATPAALNVFRNTLCADWGDIDNDGDLDLLLANWGATDEIMMNNGDGTFSNGSPLPVITNSLSTSGAFGDYDGDGYLDIVLSGSPSSYALHNELASEGNHWLDVDLVGVMSNRDGAGAKVVIQAGGLTQHRLVTVGGSKGTSPTRQHFGIGAATSIDWVEVHWPLGVVQHVDTPGIDQVVLLTESDVCGTMAPLSISLDEIQPDPSGYLAQVSWTTNYIVPCTLTWGPEGGPVEITVNTEPGTSHASGLLYTPGCGTYVATVTADLGMCSQSAMESDTYVRESLAVEDFTKQTDPFCSQTTLSWDTADAVACLVEWGVMGQGFPNSFNTPVDTEHEVVVAVQPHMMYEVRITPSTPCATASTYTWKTKLCVAKDEIQIARTGVSSIVPNPFNPSTTVSFDLAKPEYVSAKLYDSRGRLVRSLVDERLDRGVYQRTWDGRSDEGATVASGVYYLVFQAGESVEKYKLALLK